jgi:hypothetical protein
MRARVGTVLIGLLFLAPGIAFAQDAASSTSSSISLTPLWAALIGAIAAIITPFVQHLIQKAWTEKRIKSSGQHEIFRNYLAPLTDSCEKLIWRFKEIFVDGRHQFLKSVTLPLDYNEYKRTSTLFRIANLLGWLRAISLELNALPRGALGLVTPMSQSIAEVRSALADGPHVELHRLESISRVWGLALGDFSGDRKKALATDLEIKLYALGGTELTEKTRSLQDLSNDRKKYICRELCKFLCQKIGRQQLTEKHVDELVESAIQSLSYR